MVLTRVVLMAVVVGLVHMRDGSRRAFCYRPSLGLRSARWGMEVGFEYGEPRRQRRRARKKGFALCHVPIQPLSLPR